jgi:glycosyltransferase involved in cell wall biosynthesis
VKIAVIDHMSNFGGGSRFNRALLPAMKKADPQSSITYFGNPLSIARENLRAEFEKCGIEVQNLKTYALAKVKAIRRLHEKLIGVPEKYAHYPRVITGFVHQELEKRIVGYDVALFTWPFYLICPQLNCPMIGVFHDFNYKYFFGLNSLSKRQILVLERETPKWLERATPIVSTRFIVDELVKFYPQYAAKVKLVRLAPLIGDVSVSPEQARQIVADLGIAGPYLLYPTHLCIHKNIGPLLAAVAILNKKGYQIKLILTGSGTEVISGHACEIGIEMIPNALDVRGMGYVSNETMDALIKCAKVVVSTSLYEAGNGPGGDAWSQGIPVAMSNIPSFLEHIEAQGVKAQVFDPRRPEDIAAKIATILDDYEKAKTDALDSQAALRRHLSWAKTAAGYLKVCNEAVN